MGMINKIRVSSGAILLVAVLMFFDSMEVLYYAALSVFIHELGHYLAIRQCGQRVRRLNIEAFGVSMDIGSAATYKNEIIIAAAGPAASLMLTLFSAIAGRVFEFTAGYTLSGISACMLALNILPIYPLDGGRIMAAAISSAKGPMAAEKAACVSSCVFALVLMALGIYQLIMTRYNFSMLAVGLWLFICYCKSGGSVIESIR